MYPHGSRGVNSSGYSSRPSYSQPPRNAFSASPRGQELARAYPPLSVLRQQQLDLLYSRSIPRPLLNASPHLAPVLASNQRSPESPYACATSPNGSPLWCILDTGAAGTQISASYLAKAFPGIKIINDTTRFVGVDNGSSIATGRVDLKMIWTGTDGRQILTKGEAWVAEAGKLEGIGCHVLLGLPYMRDNEMNLKWSSVQRTRGSERAESLGDRLEIRGVAVEVLITV